MDKMASDTKKINSLLNVNYGASFLHCMPATLACSHIKICRNTNFFKKKNF